MTHPDGGFFTAQDADSEETVGSGQPKEGAFYVWTYEEAEQVVRCGPRPRQFGLRRVPCRIAPPNFNRPPPDCLPFLSGCHTFIAIDTKAGFLRDVQGYSLVAQSSAPSKGRQYLSNVLDTGGCLGTVRWNACWGGVQNERLVHFVVPRYRGG